MAKKEENAEQLTPQQEKMKALQAAMLKIEKDFGKGSIMRMGDEKIENVEDFDPDPFMEQLNKQGLPWHEVFDGDLEL